MYMNRLDGINIEVTNCCPLHCPQCYCTLAGGKHISLELVKGYIKEAAELGVTHIEYSGGETLCYPHIFDVIEYSKKMGIVTSISLSGWGFDENVFERLVTVGIDAIHVSLNAPSKEYNDLSRDGFEFSISALKLLKEKNFQNTIINWVMHKYTVETLPKMIELAEYYGVSAILILDPKPNADNELLSYPTFEQMVYVADIVKKNTSKVELLIHHCFSSLAALRGKNKLWGNLNRGLYKGCTAGLCSFSISVDGLFSPCRHLEYLEKWDSIQSYWENSEILEKLRNLEKTKREPCSICEYSSYCRHCLAINSKINNDLYIGNEFCPIYENGKEN